MLPAAALALLAANVAPVALAGGASANSARPDTVAVRIRFEAPPGCAGGDEFYAAILARTEHARRAVGDEDAVRLVVRLARADGKGGKDGKVEGELRVIAGRGETDTRRVEGATCKEVVQGLSLTAALALDSIAAARTHGTAPGTPVGASGGGVAGGNTPGSSGGSNAPASAAPPAPASSALAAPPREAAPPAPPPPPAPPAPPEPPAPPPRAEIPEITESGAADRQPAPSRGPHSFGLALAAHAMIAEVVSPFASFGGALTVRLAKHGSISGRGPSVGLSALYLTNDALASEDVRVRWTAGALTVCPGWSIGSAVSVEPCARGIGGWLAASDHGVTNPRSAGRSWWSAGALARATAGIGAGFELELEAGVEFPIVPRRFVTTTPEETVAETPRVSGIASLGIARGL